LRPSTGLTGRSSSCTTSAGALDFLADHKEVLENALYARVYDLFNLELDLVLWDTTTTYFESRAVESVAEYGFSKDKRPTGCRS
jgi:hypothetical protein